MATLETQYKNFLKDNPNSNLPFEQWTKVNSTIIKQAIINMMKDDEELGLYDEPFRHKVEVLSKEEILANRSNAYEFIDFDKQETLNEVALEFAKDHYEMYETSNLGSMHFGFIEGAKWREKQYTIEEQHIGHSIDDLDKSYIKGFNEGAEWQAERSYSEEEVIDLLQDFNQNAMEYIKEDEKSIMTSITLKKWFEQFKKK
jgi:hypothetical protein